MARTEHLPLYKTAYDLCLYFEQVVQSFSRYNKYTLGADLRDGARRADLRAALLGLHPDAHPGRRVLDAVAVFRLVKKDGIQIHRNPRRYPQNLAGDHADYRR